MRLKIAVAQISSESGAIGQNVERHLAAIEVAAQFNVSYLTFPELSLTDYEPELSLDLAMSVHDGRLEPLQVAATKHGIFVAAGAPVATDTLPEIGSFICAPDGSIRTYTKMHLHPGEEKYFSVGNHYELTPVRKHLVANAICADTNVADHVAGCVEKGAKIYISGAMITGNGYPTDTEILRNYARNYGIVVAMANQNSRSSSGLPCGKSAIWSPSGLLVSANRSQSAIVVAESSSAGWSGGVIEI